MYKTKLIENPNINYQFSTLSTGRQVLNSQLPFSQTKKEIFIQTKDGVLQILELQPEDRKRMTAEEFLRGYSLIN